VLVKMICCMNPGMGHYKSVSWKSVQFWSKNLGTFLNSLGKEPLCGDATLICLFIYVLLLFLHLYVNNKCLLLTLTVQKSWVLSVLSLECFHRHVKISDTARPELITKIQPISITETQRFDQRESWISVNSTLVNGFSSGLQGFLSLG
jgi:hypothetical protein